MKTNHIQVFVLLIIGCSSFLCAEAPEGVPGSERETIKEKYQVNQITYLDIAMFHFRIFGGSKNTSGESLKSTVIPGAVEQAIAFSFFIYLDSVSKSPTLKFDHSTRKRFATSCRDLTKGWTSNQISSVIKKYFPPDKDGLIGAPYLSGYSIDSLGNDTRRYLEAIHDEVHSGDK